MGIIEKLIAATAAVAGAGLAAKALSKKGKGGGVDDHVCPRCGGKLLILKDSRYGEWEAYECRRCNKTFVFCSNCDAPINNQKTFKAKNHKHLCTVCGIETAPEKYISNEGGFYECPHCGAILSEQAGFSNKCKKWKCKSCTKIVDIT